MRTNHMFLDQIRTDSGFRLGTNMDFDDKMWKFLFIHNGEVTILLSLFVP